MRSEVSKTDDTIALADLVQRIQSGDKSAGSELYNLLRDGISFFVRNELGYQDADDKIHDIFLIVLRAIHDGRLHDPGLLLAYTRSVTKRRIATEIRECIKRRTREMHVDAARIPSGQTPEQHAAEREQADIMKRVLFELRPKYREILMRYYVLGESEAQISLEMNLTATQFRLLKWRAKARFTTLAQKSLNLPVTMPREPLRPAVM